MLKDVRHDIEHKQQALSIDETCLRSNQRSFQAVQELTRSPLGGGVPPMGPVGGGRANSMPAGSRTLSPRAPGTSPRVGGAAGVHQESARNEMNRQVEAGRLNQQAAQLEEAAKLQRSDNKGNVQRCKKAVDDARHKSESTLQERINEAQAMRRRLENEIRETNNKIGHTKQTIAETRHQIKALDEPIDNTSACQSYRQQRATREHIVDPVSTKISEHQNMVLRARADLVGHHEQEKASLLELNERKERLKDDMRDKTSSMHIDLNCLSHDAVHFNGKPSTYLSKNRLSRSLKIDSRFVPMPGYSSYPMSAR